MGHNSFSSVMIGGGIMSSTKKDVMFFVVAFFPCNTRNFHETKIHSFFLLERLVHDRLLTLNTSIIDKNEINSIRLDVDTIEVRH